MCVYVCKRACKIIMCTDENVHSISSTTCIPGGVIPYDGVPLEQEVAVAIPITVTFSILAAVGIVFSVVCLAFNFVFRRKK